MAVRDVIDEGLAQLDSGEQRIAAQLARIYEQAFANIERDLAAVTRLIAEAVANGEPVSIDWLRQQGRYRRLLELIAESYQAAGFRAAPLVAEVQRLGATQGAVTGRGLLGVTIPDAHISTDLFGGVVNDDAIQRWVSALQPGSPVQAVLARQGTFAASLIGQELANGIASGYNPRKVASTILERLGGTASRADMLRITRTEMMRSFRGASLDQYARMGSAVVQVEWSASLSPRTCLACLGQHGKRFPIANPPNTFHVNCRCVLSPLPAYEFTSLAQFRQTGEQWFAKQPALVQLAMMGGHKHAHQAYRQGRLTLDDFVGERGNPIWGPTVYQRTGRQALFNAGLPG